MVISLGIRYHDHHDDDQQDDDEDNDGVHPGIYHDQGPSSR